ncbi:aldo/keto reductase [Novosphingobium resinovorum]
MKPAVGTRAGSDNKLYQWVCEEYANIDRNWATIAEVMRIANEIGATPSQVALSWIADRPGVTAPIFGARNMAQLKDSIAAAELTLDDAASAALEAVSRPTPGGYPYGAFGQGQRNRDLHDGVPAPVCRYGAAPNILRVGLNHAQPVAGQSPAAGRGLEFGDGSGTCDGK